MIQDEDDRWKVSQLTDATKGIYWGRYGSEIARKLGLKRVMVKPGHYEWRRN